VTGDRDLLAMTWATYPHLYVDYYTFQYTTGLAAAQALAAPIIAGAAGAAERYLEFLGAGLSKPPLDALQDAGVDMGSPAPLDAAFTVLGVIIDRIETLCG
jgi:oligoendopeptidase F